MLDGERARGQTFDPANIGWIDFETKSETDIRAGTARYTRDAKAIVLVYAIGDGPVMTIAVKNFEKSLAFYNMPDEFIDFYGRVAKGKAVFAAWNASFDRAVWTNATGGFPVLKPHYIIDVMAQATAAGLPPDLAGGAYHSRSTHKVASGKELIRHFCVPDAPGTPQNSPEKWLQFLSYAAGDIVAMRDVFRATMQLPIAEWKEYWASEVINDRGAAIDVPFVMAAARLATEDRAKSGQEIFTLTRGEVKSVDEVKKMSNWLLAHLPVEGRKELIKRQAEVDDDGVVTKPPTYSLTRKQVTRLITYVKAAMEDVDMSADQLTYMIRALRILELRLYGGSKTPQKFQRMMDTRVGAVLYNSYVFNGAGQTGRFSSRGVQVHNLAREPLDYEYDAINSICTVGTHSSLAELGDGATVSRKLSLLIRPAFVPELANNAFVWSDWSNIEARILPWLAGDEERLDIFRAVDKNPKIPDLYTRTAAQISGIGVEQVTEAIRQRGKVVELALGFGGGVGALQNMAAGYGMYLDDAEARQIVETWRRANPWCVKFWGVHNDNDSYGLWGAAHRAMERPGEPQWAGNCSIAYIYLGGYLGGSLLAMLPSGRMLTYRDIRYEMVDEEDDDGNVVAKKRALRFARGHSRIALWHGMLCENVVQAVAADCLRGTLRRLVDLGADVRLHTHDEILLECPVGDVEDVSEGLRSLMRRGFDWSKGLPLMSGEKAAYSYTKCKREQGL